jgi:hypothetical protein
VGVPPACGGVVAGEVTAGGAGELLGEVALEEAVVGGVVEAGDAVPLGSGVPLVVAVVGGPGGDVARGGGQVSSESANNFRSCDSA